MTFDGDFIRSIMRILYGKFVLTSREAEALAALLGSREEFLAWLLLRNGLAAKDDAIGHVLRDVATSAIVTSTTRRIESGYPVFERQDMVAMETEMKALLHATEAARDQSNKVNAVMISYMTRHGNDVLIGQTLGIRFREEDCANG